MENTCKNCAWFCHSDGQCYGRRTDGDRVTIFGLTGKCSDWTFDGLEDWEREDCEKSALMAMELA